MIWGVHRRHIIEVLLWNVGTNLRCELLSGARRTSLCSYWVLRRTLSHVCRSWWAVPGAKRRKVISVSLTCHGTIIICLITCIILSDLGMCLRRARVWCVVTSAVKTSVPDI